MDRKIVKKKDRRVFVDFCYKGEIDNLPEPSESELGHIYSCSGKFYICGWRENGKSNEWLMLNG